jgi:hypothetical protein
MVLPTGSSDGRTDTQVSSNTLSNVISIPSKRKHHMIHHNDIYDEILNREGKSREKRESMEGMKDSRDGSIMKDSRDGKDSFPMRFHNGECLCNESHCEQTRMNNILCIRCSQIIATPIIKIIRGRARHVLTYYDDKYILTYYDDKYIEYPMEGKNAIRFCSKCHDSIMKGSEKTRLQKLVYQS